MPSLSATDAAAAYRQSLADLTPLQSALVEDRDFTITDRLPPAVRRARALFEEWQAVADQASAPQ